MHAGRLAGTGAAHIYRPAAASTGVTVQAVMRQSSTPLRCITWNYRRMSTMHPPTVTAGTSRKIIVVGYILETQQH